MRRSASRLSFGIPVLVCVFLAGCVCNKKYKKQLDKAAELEARLADEKKENAALKKRLSNMKSHGDKLSEELGKEKKARKEAEALRVKGGSEEKEKLAKLREEAKAQSKLLKDLTQQFEPLIRGKKISLKVVHGRMVLKLRSAVLFDSGKDELKPMGKTTLKQIGNVLKKVRGRHFQVAGHTDNQPIKKSKFPSNWHLSAARAVAVVKFLQELGVKPGTLSAAGFSQYQPVARNTVGWGRRRNRRIEISLLPSIPSRLLKEAEKEAKPRK